MFPADNCRRCLSAIYSYPRCEHKHRPTHTRTHLHALTRQSLADDALRFGAERALLRPVPRLKLPDVLRREKHLRARRKRRGEQTRTHGSTRRRIKTRKQETGRTRADDGAHSTRLPTTGSKFFAAGVDTPTFGERNGATNLGYRRKKRESVERRDVRARARKRRNPRCPWYCSSKKQRASETAFAERPGQPPAQRTNPQKSQTLPHKHERYSFSIKTQEREREMKK